MTKPKFKIGDMVIDVNIQASAGKGIIVGKSVEHFLYYDVYWFGMKAVIPYHKKLLKRFQTKGQSIS